jgi:hypothetical protein
MPPTPNFRVPWVDVDAEAEKQYRAFVTTRSLESRVLECLPVVSEFSEHLNFSLCPSVMREVRLSFFEILDRNCHSIIFNHDSEHVLAVYTGVGAIAQNPPFSLLVA